MFNDKATSKEIIDMFYEKEARDGIADNVVKQSITVRVETPYAAMLNALSRRFGHTRGGITQHMLEAETLKMFEALTDKDQELLAKEADDETTKLMLDAGHQIKSSNSAGNFENEWSEWRSHVATRKAFKRMSEKSED